MSQVLTAMGRAPAFLCCGSQDVWGQTPLFTQEGLTTLRVLFTAPIHWAGLGNILHGGFQALLLDDMLCRVATDLTNVDPAAPKELILRYHRPVPVDKPLSILGYLVEEGDQEITTSGEIKDAQGNLLTEAEGVFTRTSPENTWPSKAQPEFANLAHWPAWSACCRGPLERLWNLQVDWKLAPDQSALGGTLQLPPTLQQIPPAGVLAALFDQALGLLGKAQGHGVLLTVRLQVTVYSPLPIEKELILLGQGQRRQEGPFKAQAWLKYRDSLVAEASANFSVLTWK